MLQLFLLVAVCGGLLFAVPSSSESVIGSSSFLSKGDASVAKVAAPQAVSFRFEAPTGLTITPIPGDRWAAVHVSWTHVPPPPTGDGQLLYDVELEGWGWLPDTPDNKFHVTMVPPCKDFSFRVRAKNKVTIGPWSARVSQFVKMPVPGGLTTQPVSLTSVRAYWNTVDFFSMGPKTGYELEVNGQLAPNQLPSDQPFYTFNNVPAGYTRTYRVRAKSYESDCVSDWSAPVTGRGLSPDIPKTGWKVVSVDSQEKNHPATHAFDGNPSTFWHTEWLKKQPNYPHELVIDLGARYDVDALRYLPRPGGGNGSIGTFQVFFSTSTSSWEQAVAWGSFTDDKTEKVVTLSPRKVGRYLKLVALTEAGRRGPWASAAEISVNGFREV